MRVSFLMWHRDREYYARSESCLQRGGQHQHRQHKTRVCACRYWYEFCDGFWGQFALTQLPHVSPAAILPRDTKHLLCMQKFAGALEYLSSGRWQSPGVICAYGDMVFSVEALPLVVDDLGVLQQMGAYAQDAAVFSSDRVAFEYLVSLAQRDLKYRGFRDERITTFSYRTEALFQLYTNVRDCQDEHEYALLRQRWDAVNRPAHVGWNGARDSSRPWTSWSRRCRMKTRS